MRMTLRCLVGAAVALVFAAVAPAAHAQYRAEFSLPFEVHWGHAVLPAGDYTLSLSSIGQPMRVVDDTGRTRALVYGSVERPRVGQGAALLVSRDGNTRTVRSLNCPPWGVDLVYRPFTRAERELVASGRQVDQLPVRIASR